MNVSIHAPHAGRDNGKGKKQTGVYVSIHAPHAGRDGCLTRQSHRKGVSIHAPHAGRDTTSSTGLTHVRCFNPRAPCGARPDLIRVQSVVILFQSTRPMRGATESTSIIPRSQEVSIHAPHAGRDNNNKVHKQIHQCFNPRAPCGARPRNSEKGALDSEFQSTRPMRGATKFFKIFRKTSVVSIHAPHAGRDARSISESVS